VPGGARAAPGQDKLMIQQRLAGSVAVRRAPARRRPPTVCAGADPAL